MTLQREEGPDASSAPERPLREVLALVPFRRFLVAQFLSALVNGTLRFVLVWLTLELTAWKPAVGLVGLALGLASLAVALPAGAISDRVDRRSLFVRLSGLTAAVLASATFLVATGRAGVWAIALHAAVLGALLAAVSPAVQAMVPALVPRERLMNGVALQLMTMNVAMMLGVVAGGAAITLAGDAGGLGLLAVLEALAALLMLTVRMPPAPAAAPPDDNTPAPGLRADIAEGVRWALAHEPVRSLLGVMVIVGFMWSGVQLLLPDLARDDLDQGALGAGVLFAPLGLGMLVTSLLLGSRAMVARPGRLLAIVFTANAGPLVVAIGLSRSYPLTLVLMAIWGVGGGVVMTLQRTLLQQHTPDRLMGRSMGLNTLGMLGSFPIAAAVVSGLTAVAGTGVALAAMGAATAALAAVVTLRPALLEA